MTIKINVYYSYKNVILPNYFSYIFCFPLFPSVVLMFLSHVLSSHSSHHYFLDIHEFPSLITHAVFSLI